MQRRLLGKVGVLPARRLFHRLAAWSLLGALCVTNVDLCPLLIARCL